MSTSRSMEDLILLRMKLDGIEQNDWLRVSKRAMIVAPFLEGHGGALYKSTRYTIRAKDLADTLGADFDLRFMFWFNGVVREHLSEEALRDRLEDWQVVSVAEDFLSEYTARVLDPGEITALNEASRGL